MLNYVALMCRRQSPESGYWTFWNLPKTILHRLLGGLVSPQQSEFGQSRDVCDSLWSGALDLHKSSLVLCFQKYSIQTWWDRYSCCGFIIIFWYASICLCCLYDFMCLCWLQLFEKHLNNQMQYPWDPCMMVFTTNYFTITYQLYKSRQIYVYIYTNHPMDSVIGEKPHHCWLSWGPPLGVRQQLHPGGTIIKNPLFGRFGRWWFSLLGYVIVNRRVHIYTNVIYIYTYYMYKILCMM